MSESNLNPKSLAISILVIGLLSLLLMYYISSYANNAANPESTDGTSRSNCIKEGGKWGGVTTYSAGGNKQTDYFCYK